MDAPRDVEAVGGVGRLAVDAGADHHRPAGAGPVDRPLDRLSGRDHLEGAPAVVIVAAAGACGRRGEEGERYHGDDEGGGLGEATGRGERFHFSSW